MCDTYVKATYTMYLLSFIKANDLSLNLVRGPIVSGDKGNAEAVMAICTLLNARSVRVKGVQLNAGCKGNRQTGIYKSCLLSNICLQCMSTHVQMLSS